MGIFPDAPLRVRDADGVEQLQDPGGHRPAVTIGVGRHRLGDLAPHRQNRVEGGLGLLKDHTHAPAPHPAHGALRQCQQRGIVKPDAASGNAARGGQQAHQGQGCHGLATTRLPQQGKGLAGADRQIQAIHDPEGWLTLAEMGLKALDTQQGWG